MSRGGNNSNDPFLYAQMMNNQQQQSMATNNTTYMMQDNNNNVQKLQQFDEEKIYGLVLELLNPSTREQALLDLSKKREQYEDLALVLWYSYGKY